jgi:para-nitrobenzyl esterase
LQQGRLASKYVPVYEYVFSDEQSPPLAHVPNFNLGAAHAQDLSYLFPHYDDTNAHKAALLTGDSLEISNKMIGYWTTFAHSNVLNKPNQKPMWPLFKTSSAVMNFATGQIETFDASKAHHCNFWDHLYH